MSVSRPGASLQEIYNNALLGRAKALVLEIANASRSIIDLNPEMTVPAQRIYMNAAAYLIRIGSEDILDELCAFQEFNLNARGASSRGFTALHAACHAQNQKYVDRCLAELKRDFSSEEVKKYVNQEIEWDQCASISAFALSLVKSAKPELSDKLLEAGADPYTQIVSKNGPVHSMFFLPQAMSTREYYKQVIVKDRAKYKKLLETPLKFITAQKEVVYLNLVEEGFVWLDNSLSKPYDISPSLVYQVTDELSPAVLHMIFLQELYRELYLDVQEAVAVPKINVNNLGKRLKAIRLAAAKDKEKIGKIFTTNTQVLAKFTSNGKYINGFTLHRLKRTIGLVDFMADLDIFFIVANCPDVMLPVLSDLSEITTSSRRNIQPFYGVYKGHTPITYAVLVDHRNFIDFCIHVSHPELDAPVIDGPYKGFTPLALALFENHIRLAQKLLVYLLKKYEGSSRMFNEPLTGVLAGATIESLIEISHAEIRKFYAQSKQAHTLDNRKMAEEVNFMIDNLRAERDRFRLCVDVTDDRYPQWIEMDKQKLPKKLMVAEIDNNSLPFIRETVAQYHQLATEFIALTKNMKTIDKSGTKDEKAKTTKKIKGGLVKSAPAEAVTLKPSKVVMADITVDDGKAKAFAEKLVTANREVRVFNSFLNKIKDNTHSKLALLDEDIAANVELVASSANIFAMQEIEEESSPDLAAEKLEECQQQNAFLNDLDKKFNAIYKKCDREQKLRNEKKTQQFKNFGEAAVVPAVASNVRESVDDDHPDDELAPKPKVEVGYDVHGDGFVQLPKKYVAARKLAFAGARYARQFAETSISSSSNISVPSDTRVVSLLTLTQQKIIKLKALYFAYKEYCAARKIFGMADVECAMAISAMHAEIIAIFEAIFVLQRDYAEFGIYNNARTAEEWRNMSKYVYGYIFSHEANYFTQLVGITLDLIANAVNNRLNGKNISVVNQNQIPQDLMHAYQNAESDANDSTEQLNLRLQNMKMILASLNTRVKASNPGTVEAGIAMHEDSARAKLFCLALLGQVEKSIDKKSPASSVAKYGALFVSNISKHTSGKNFISDLRTEKSTPLLNYLSTASKEVAAREKARMLIANMGNSDMAKLRREILNVISHQVESEWLSLENRHLRDFIDCIAKRCEQLYAPHPGVKRTYVEVVMSDSSKAAKLCLHWGQWESSEEINRAAMSHPFFQALRAAIQAIASNNLEEAASYDFILLQSVGKLNRFECFSNQFLKNPADKESIAMAHTLFKSVVERCKQINMAALSLRM